MSQIAELLQENALHSVRSDGSQMIAFKTEAGQDTEHVEWEVFFVGKNRHIDNDGALTLTTGEKAVLRKVHSSERIQEIANHQDFVEWQAGFLEEHPDEHDLILQDKLRAAEDELQKVNAQKEETEKQLQDARARLQELTTQRRKERSTHQLKLEEMQQQIINTAADIAERTPSHTQKIIANQVQLSAGYYEEVGEQSRDSFRLSLRLAIAGGVIFFLTVLATVFISLLRGNTALVTIIGSCAAGLTEALAASNRLYNQASHQFANFQVYLDRIDRSSICYSMISEEAFEQKTAKQQEEIVKIIDALLASK